MVAIGGNALIREGEEGTIAQQMANARAIAAQVVGLLQGGLRVVVTHGNGPQVGFIMLRSELVDPRAPVPRLTLDMCVADSEGGLGYILANALAGELRRHGFGDRAVCVLTHTVVDADDPAFGRPTKPIGPFFTAAEAEQHRRLHGWTLIEDSGRGYRRLVPSPRPRRIVEQAAIARLVEAEFVVVAAGGGGIAVVEEGDGRLRGVEAVVDKDYASALLAAAIGIPLLIISTGIERIAIHFRRPDERFLDRMTAAEARRYLEAGEFPEGSMGPKVRAALEFLDAGGEEVIVASPWRLADAVAGSTGTRIVRS
ncbi:MAG TPA: carbamate kinase [Chloroflexota bacterium]